MKLTNFIELEEVVNTLNIEIVAKTELEIFETEGLDTDLSDVYTSEYGELYTILSNGEIRKNIIHICNPREYKGKYTLPKFHIFDCQKITEMKNNNRKHRYKKASNPEGDFIVYTPNESQVSLNICGFCLRQYNSIYAHYKTVDDFNIREYLQEPMKHSNPSMEVDIDITTIPDDYIDNWDNISYKRKQYYNWRCQECHIDLSDKRVRRFLHTHHMDANRSNNSYENLKVVCIECHSNEFQHTHMKSSPDYHEFLRYKENLNMNIIEL